MNSNIAKACCNICKICIGRIPDTHKKLIKAMINGTLKTSECKNGTIICKIKKI